MTGEEVIQDISELFVSAAMNQHRAGVDATAAEELISLVCSALHLGMDLGVNHRQHTKAILDAMCLVWQGQEDASTITLLSHYPINSLRASELCPNCGTRHS